MHASCESPCHLSAKRCLLDTCFLLTAPFRTMLLTARGGPRCLGPKAYGVPVHLIAFLHSYFALNGAHLGSSWGYLRVRVGPGSAAALAGVRHRSRDSDALWPCGHGSGPAGPWAAHDPRGAGGGRGRVPAGLAAAAPAQA